MSEKKTPVWRRWWMICIYVVVVIVALVTQGGGESQTDPVAEASASMASAEASASSSRASAAAESSAEQSSAMASYEASKAAKEASKQAAASQAADESGTKATSSGGVDEVTAGQACDREMSSEVAAQGGKWNGDPLMSLEMAEAYQDKVIVKYSGTIKNAAGGKTEATITCTVSGSKDAPRVENIVRNN